MLECLFVVQFYEAGIQNEMLMPIEIALLH